MITGSAPSAKLFASGLSAGAPNRNSVPLAGIGRAAPRPRWPSPWITTRPHGVASTSAGDRRLQREGRADHPQADALLAVRKQEGDGEDRGDPGEVDEQGCSPFAAGTNPGSRDYGNVARAKVKRSWRC